MTVGRPAARRTVHSRTVRAGCRSSRSPPTARSATCSPARPSAGSTPVPAPPGFTGTLRPYQERGLAWLAFLQSLGLGAILADDMGLGKTARCWRCCSGDAGPAGRRCWSARCRWSATGSGRRRVRARPAGARPPRRRAGPGHGVRDRGGRRRPGHHHLRAGRPRRRRRWPRSRWHRLVVDEAQAIKNAATRQAVAVRALPARHRIAVTGTPVENRLADLWSIMEFANPGLLGSALRVQGALRRAGRAARRRGGGRAAAPAHRARSSCAASRPTSRSSPICRTRSRWRCSATSPPSRRSLYQAVVDDMLARIEQSEGIERRGPGAGHDDQAQAGLQPPGPAAARRQPAGRPLGQARPARGDPRGGARRAARRRCCSPSTPSSAACCAPTWPRGSAARSPSCTAACPRPSATRWWPASSRPSRRSPSLFVLSLKAGGTGLTLTAANHVIHVDRWWNPAVEDQATDRAFRIGQTPQRPGAQVRLRRHGRGEDLRDDPARSGAWRRRSSAPARLAHRAVHIGAARAVRARGRGGGRMRPRRPFERVRPDHPGRGRAQGPQRPRRRSASRGGPSGSSPCWSRSRSAPG